MQAIIMLLCLSSSALAQDGAAKISRDSEKRAAHESVLLVAGMQTTMDLKFNPCSNTLECLRVGNKQLFELQYSAQKHQLIFTPQKPGETTVVLRDEQGDIQLVIDALVSNVNLKRRAAEATEALKGVKGIKVLITADYLTLDGEVNDLESLRRIRLLTSDAAFKNVVLELAHPSAALMKKAAAAIQKQLGAGVKLETFGESLVLSGAGSENFAAQAEQLALALGLRAAQGARLIIAKGKKP